MSEVGGGTCAIAACTCLSPALAPSGTTPCGDHAPGRVEVLSSDGGQGAGSGYYLRIGYNVGNR